MESVANVGVDGSISAEAKCASNEIAEASESCINLIENENNAVLDTDAYPEPKTTTEVIDPLVGETPEVIEPSVVEITPQADSIVVEADATVLEVKLQVDDTTVVEANPEPKATTEEFDHIVAETKSETVIEIKPDAAIEEKSDTVIEDKPEPAAEDNPDPTKFSTKERVTPKRLFEMLRIDFKEEYITVTVNPRNPSSILELADKNWKTVAEEAWENEWLAVPHPELMAKP